jgi:hypothetical protein
VFFAASRPVLGPFRHPVRWVSGIVFLAVKRPVREAEHSPLSDIEVKNAWSYASTSSLVMTRYLINHMNNLAFTLCLIVAVIIIIIIETED